MSRRTSQFPLNRDQVRDLLERAGIQPTQQRVDIAHLLFQRPQHLSADQVLEQVNRHYGHVSKATIYNTLGLFVRHGLINEVSIEPDRTLFDSNTSEHHHVYDLDTGELSDLPAGCLAIQGDLGLPEGTRVEGLDVVVRVRSGAGREGAAPPSRQDRGFHLD